VISEAPRIDEDAHVSFTSFAASPIESCGVMAPWSHFDHQLLVVGHLSDGAPLPTE